MYGVSRTAIRNLVYFRTPVAAHCEERAYSTIDDYTPRFGGADGSPPPLSGDDVGSSGSVSRYG